MSKTKKEENELIECEGPCVSMEDKREVILSSLKRNVLERKKQEVDENELSSRFNALSIDEPDDALRELASSFSLFLNDVPVTGAEIDGMIRRGE